MEHGADHDLAAIAALIADRSRAAMLSALLGGHSLTGIELARVAGVARSTASEHLTRLVSAGLVAARPTGRHRYYTLASPAVADALERLGAIAPTQRVSTLRQARVGEALREARSCYDHLAGRVAIELVDALTAQGVIVVAPDAFELTPPGARRLREFGIDVDGLRRERRAFARRCLDWSERRDHVAGGLGAALLRRLLELDWLRRDERSRALGVTDAGRGGFAERFSVMID